MAPSKDIPNLICPSRSVAIQASSISKPLVRSVVSKWHSPACDRNSRAEGCVRGSPPVTFNDLMWLVSNCPMTRVICDSSNAAMEICGEEASKQCLQHRLQCLVMTKSTRSGVLYVNGVAKSGRA